MSIILGCIADDFTGATDLANTLVKQGLPTIQLIGVPKDEIDLGDAQAVVVALKSRTIPAQDAIQQSLEALTWLKAQGAGQFFFKYCSTFDSTNDGNIGPVADALMEALDTDFTIACPAFPTNGRTIYKGNLFVGNDLLSDSGMRNHPLTPMTDSNLVRVLARQTPHKVALVEHGTVSRGDKAILEVYDGLRVAGARHAIVDAIDDQDLLAIAAASADLKLITGGSGVALGLPENYRIEGKLSVATAVHLPSQTGYEAILAGSCSIRTREQVAAWQVSRPSFQIEPDAVMAGENVAEQAVAWAEPLLAGGPVLIYSSADPDDVAQVQAKYGAMDVGEKIETVLGKIAKALVAKGVDKIIAAGGETSGAVVGALGVQALRIGPEISPGVPWTESISAAPKGAPIALALKSGNFGEVNFFENALEMLRGR
jgi:3-dehydrotetronate 4-kinase